MHNIIDKSIGNIFCCSIFSIFSPYPISSFFPHRCSAQSLCKCTNPYTAFRSNQLPVDSISFSNATLPSI
ncbi:hypothetical protein L1987_71032 [Smallanthus sonchifolius]|uniref:Uncharacterized protein n=1 Tax=Smallanthus sonchifolius TaxID=185202 RepID=A0ACB9ARB6_9ASTR|nr:hypothetical protein L1987_71032 [Smallanthus sonchifolius]